jgi:hypothetical protein
MPQHALASIHARELLFNACPNAAAWTYTPCLRASFPHVLSVLPTVNSSYHELRFQGKANRLRLLAARNSSQLIGVVLRVFVECRQGCRSWAFSGVLERGGWCRCFLGCSLFDGLLLDWL